MPIIASNCKKCFSLYNYQYNYERTAPATAVNIVPVLNEPQQQHVFRTVIFNYLK